MATLTFKGNTIHSIGELPKSGQIAPAFKATTYDLEEVTLKNYLGKRTLILNIFPSLDTSVCANTMRRFEEISKQLPAVTILCISADLPFAQQRFCALEHLNNVVPLSIFRHAEFGKDYGLLLIDGPLEGLLARGIVVIDQNGKILYTELVKELTDEPNYTGMIAAIEKTILA